MAGIVKKNVPNVLTGDGTGSERVTGVNIYGKGGSIRHTGHFSSDNPYLQNLLLAENNADKDALYAQAVEAEADMSRTEQDRAYAREVLEEQREYDDPLNVMARQRSAGINSDLAGGSSSASSSSGAQENFVPTSDVNNQVRYNNVYDNALQVMNGINTATSFVSSISSLGTTIGGLVEMSALLPSHKRQSEADAYVAENTKNERVDIAKQASRGAKLANLNSALDFTGRLAQLVTPNTTFEDAHSIFRQAGIPQEDYETTYQDIQSFHKNPQAIADYNNRQVAAKHATAMNTATTIERLGRIYENMLLADQYTAKGNFYNSIIESDVAEILASSPYAQQTALNEISSEENESTSLSLENENLDLQLQKMRFDINAFGEFTKYIAKKRNDVNKRLDDAYNKLDSLSLGTIDYGRQQAFIESLEAEIMILDVIGSNQVNSLRNVYNRVSQNSFMTNFTRMGLPGGKLINYEGPVAFSNMLFHDVLNDPDSLNALIGGTMDILTTYLSRGRYVPRKTRAMTGYNQYSLGSLMPDVKLP